jgi:hypothetical protein
MFCYLIILLFCYSLAPLPCLYPRLAVVILKATHPIPPYYYCQSDLVLLILLTFEQSHDRLNERLNKWSNERLNERSRR